MARMANQAASSSSYITNSYTYDVFLSFSGEDTCNSFTGYLYSALWQKGISTFIDDGLRRGEKIPPSLLREIEESKISIVIFSENYAKSKWCLDELEKILECKKSEQQIVRPIFYKVDPSDVRNQRGSYGEALAQHECKFKDDIEKVSRWRDALSEAANLSGWPFLDGHESQFIRKIVEEISVEVLHQTCLHVATYPVGLKSCARDVVELLEVGGDGVRMVGIWGMGGVGKTTIAKAVYNSVASKFDGSCFLANVRENSRSRGGVVQLQETLLADILRVKGLKVPSVDRGVELIKKRLGNKKVFLILDDVDHLEQLNEFAPVSDWFGSGSRIIITTRDLGLLTAHQVFFVYDVKLLDEQKALELFSWNAFKTSRPPNGYEELAILAVLHLQGHPLALIVLGSHLCGRSADQWKSTLNSCKTASNKHVNDFLIISYSGLDDHVKNVFLDIACFFKGKDLAYATESLQCCDLNPTTCIQELVEKALITIDGTRILMHGLLEEMGKNIVYQESPNEPRQRSRLWHSEDIYDVLTQNTASPSLMHLYIEGCEFLEKIPDVTSMPNLMHLDLSYCTSLVEVHPSVGFLDKLLVLRLRGCSNLVIFPRRISLKSLEVIDLSDCSRLAYFPVIVGKMESLRYMNLQGSAIKSLPLLQHREVGSTNAGHHQEASVLMKQDDTNVHQEQAYPQAEKEDI